MNRRDFLGFATGGMVAATAGTLQMQRQETH
ncbi:twin-arginine translocation signal domain-containing protein [Rhizobium sp. YTUHZ044]